MSDVIKRLVMANNISPDQREKLVATIKQDTEELQNYVRVMDKQRKLFRSQDKTKLAEFKIRKYGKEAFLLNTRFKQLESEHIALDISEDGRSDAHQKISTDYEGRSRKSFLKLKNKLPIIAKNKEILQAVALTSRSASMSDCSTTLEIIPDHEEQDIAENNQFALKREHSKICVLSSAVFILIMTFLLVALIIAKAF